MATILIVDDRPLNRQFLVTLLGYGGHTLLEAADGQEALRVVMEYRPDLVISDLVMPIMDGQELIRRLRADPEVADTPIIFYTATYRESDAQAIGIAWGVRRVLRKPCEPEVMLAAVEDALKARYPYGGRSGSSDDKPPMPQALDLPLAKMLDRTGGASAGAAQPSLRLAALIELGVELGTRRDIPSLLQVFCRRAHECLGARYTALGIVDEHRPDRLQHFIVQGMDRETQERLGEVPARNGFLERALSQRAPTRLAGLDGDPVQLGLPASHPPVRSFLLVPVSSTFHTYGWVYFADRIETAAFGEDDERIASTIATQLAVAYENLLLLEEVQVHAAQLRQEAAERLRAEEEVRRLNAELEQRVRERTAELAEANRELETFSYSVSHDLRTPLRGIDGYSAALLEDYGQKLDEQAHHYLGQIRDASARMAMIIDDLLDLSRVTRAPLRKAPVSLTELAQRVVAELCKREPSRKVAVDIAEGLTAHGDAHLLAIALENLLGNAWKFTAKHSEPQIAFGQEKEENKTVFHVRDNGAGFDMAYADKLFAPFQRLHGASEFEGTGIGLVTVHRIITRHGGHIWAQAAVNEGATVYFTLSSSQ